MAEVGDIILRAAQGIVAQQQQQQQMQFKLVQFEEQVAQTEKNFDLRQRELDLRDRAIKVQEDQAKRAGELAPFKAQQAELRIEQTGAEIDLLKARTAAVGTGSGGRGMTPNQRVSIEEDIFNTGRQLDIARSIQEFPGVPQVQSFEDLDKRMRANSRLISQMELSKTANEAQLVAGIKAQEEGKPPPQFEIDAIRKENEAIQAYLSSEQGQSLRQRHQEFGISRETREQVIASRYGQIADLLGEEPVERVTRFNYGAINPRGIDLAWDQLGKGVAGPLSDLISDQGPLTADKISMLSAEALQRFPEPGPEQDQAIAAFKAMIDSFPE